LIPAALPSPDELAQPIPAQTYMWSSKDSYLEKELWSSDEFVGNYAYRSIGPEAESSEEYEEVDEAKVCTRPKTRRGGRMTQTLMGALPGTRTWRISR